MKAVRFHPVLETVGFTYSAMDYDRSFFPTAYMDHDDDMHADMIKADEPVFAKSPLPASRPSILPLDLSSITVSSKPKKLTINTAITQPPLYFTNLTTQYKAPPPLFDDDDDDDSCSTPSPFSATP
ncbi:hypothetical protein BC940DRAFT_337272 [Gongronella butleri]|nr:hypothetical protein BC940DRAFT_337272 [Gongronella butleri]